MNTTKYMQTDGRWSQLPFRNLPDNIGNNGCGEVSICNMIIEMSQYKNYTPATIQPYCRQFATPKGISHAGIPQMMKHYGLTEVKECPTMQPLWKEMAKGNRVALLIMNSTPAGTKGVKWTSSGHCIAVTGYRYKDNDHQVYVKDSYSYSSNRNGWLGYKTHLRGAVYRVWVGKLSGSPAPTPTPTPTPTGKLVVDGKGGPATIKRMQQFFKTTQDGVISGQMKQYAPYYPSLNAVKYGKGGSSVVTALQKWLNLKGPYGIIGPNTTKAWQRRLRDLGYLASSETIDGIFGVKSMSAWQEALNNDCKPKGKQTTTKPVANSKAGQINSEAINLSWTVGTNPSKYAYKGGSACTNFKNAWKKYFPKKKNTAGCHQFVMLVLKVCGYPTMNISSWSKILSYLRKNFNEIKPTYKESQLQAGDIGVYKRVDSKGKSHYHIWVIVKVNGKLAIAEAQQSKNYSHINTSLKKALTKHNADYIFRAK